MKTKIPVGAMPVVEILRRDVDRPTATIVSEGRVGAPRFECGKCPMGLFPLAQTCTPETLSEFLGSQADLYSGLRATALIDAIDTFWNWWDFLTVEEARVAVDLIWPQEAQR